MNEKEASLKKGDDICYLPTCNTQVEEKWISGSGWGSQPRKVKICKNGHIQPENRPLVGW